MKKFFVALFAFIIGISVATGCGGTSTSSTSSSSSSTTVTTLSSISVKTLPYKLKYYSHETINTAGGQIELAFTNNTKQVIDMSDDMINYSSVNMATLGKQNVELRYTYKGVTKSTTYQVEIEDSNIYVTNIYLDKDYAEIMVGGGVALKEIVLPKNATNQAVEWVSSDPSIAIVSSQGVVEGLKEGSVVITATAKDKGTKIATATIVVKNPKDDTITVTLRRELTLSLQTVYEKYNSSNYTSSNYEILTGYYNDGIEGISSAKTSTEANAAFVNATRKMALVAVNVTTPVVDYAEFSFSGDDLTVTSGGLVNPTSIGRSVVANLVIDASVGDEEVTLDGITVTGTTTVNGGGSHSIIAVNVVFVGTITIDKNPTTGEETVRVEFSVTTTVISDIVVANNATLTANTPLPRVTVNATVTTALIQGSSSIGQITAAASIEVDIDGVVDSLEVSSRATSAPTITVNSTVQLITNNYSGAEIEGNGQISNVIATVSTTVAVTVPVTNVELSGGTLTVNQPVNNVVVTASTSVVIAGSSTVDYVDVPSTTLGTLSVSVANVIISNQSTNPITISVGVTIAAGETKKTDDEGGVGDVTELADLKKVEVAKLERKFATINSLYYSSANYTIISANYDRVKSAINASTNGSELDTAKANIDYIDYSDGTSSGSHITASAYILKIEDNLSASIYRGNSTTLPSSIEVTLKNPNGTTSTNQSVSVTWNSVDQTQIGYGVHQV
ncbi:MAG: Ig-like domain-containing protein, partial [Erysipelotrichales bacterium]|nr:Ig-like domain-containing protein [Erysipelotrichales bacterium]